MTPLRAFFRKALPGHSLTSLRRQRAEPHHVVIFFHSCLVHFNRQCSCLVARGYLEVSRPLVDE